MRASRKIRPRMPPRHPPGHRVPCTEVEQLVRAAWVEAGRTPTWPPPAAGHRGFLRTTVARLRPYAAFLGWIDDYALERRSGISRASILIIREACGIPPAPRRAVSVWTVAQARDWEESLRAGTPLSRLAERAGVKPGLVRAFASTIGWHRSWIRRG